MNGRTCNGDCMEASDSETTGPMNKILGFSLWTTQTTENNPYSTESGSGWTSCFLQSLCVLDKSVYIRLHAYICLKKCYELFVHLCVCVSACVCVCQVSNPIHLSQQDLMHMITSVCVCVLCIVHVRV